MSWSSSRFPGASMKKSTTGCGPPSSGCVTKAFMSPWSVLMSTSRSITARNARARAPGGGTDGSSPAAQVHRPGVEHVVAVDHVQPLVVRDGGVDVGRHDTNAVSDAGLVLGHERNVLVRAE